MNKTHQRQLRRRYLETLELSPEEMAAFMWLGSYPDQGPVETVHMDFLWFMGLIDFKTYPQGGTRITGDGDYYARFNVHFIKAVMDLHVTTDMFPLREETIKLGRKAFPNVVQEVPEAV